MNEVAFAVNTKTKEFFHLNDISEFDAKQYPGDGWVPSTFSVGHDDKAARKQGLINALKANGAKEIQKPNSAGSHIN